MFSTRCIPLYALLISGTTFTSNKVGPGFSLLNKADSLIYALVDNGSNLDIDQLSSKDFVSLKMGVRPYIKIKDLEIQPVSSYEASRGVQQETGKKSLPYKDTLFVNKKIDWKNKSTIVHIYDRNNQELYRAQCPAGKTIYVQWDGTSLYPQTGPLRGLQGTTDQGFDLRYNVKTKDLIQLPIR
jgi:hypothetical protein